MSSYDFYMAWHQSFFYLCAMQFEKIHNKGQARLFKSDYLETYTLDKDRTYVK